MDRFLPTLCLPIIHGGLGEELKHFSFCRIMGYSDEDVWIGIKLLQCLDRVPRGWNVGVEGLWRS